MFAHTLGDGATLEYGQYWSTKFPTIPGYQKVGRVESVGAEVTNYQVGDLEYGKIYYWKVNEVNDAANPPVQEERKATEPTKLNAVP